MKSDKQKPPHKGDGGWWEGGVVEGVVGGGVWWGRGVEGVAEGKERERDKRGARHYSPP